jgi:hypothetical protein
MDFVRELPESTPAGFMRILVIADQLAKIKIYLACRKDIIFPEVAQMFVFELVICKCGVPDHIVTDRGTIVR